MDNITAIKNFINGRMPEYLRLLQEMVAINSFTANAEGVNHLGATTARIFEELGFVCETIPADNPSYGNHVFLTRPGKTPTKIGLVSHLDTVFPPEEEIQNLFQWRIEGERAYGPGTVDIKGGTVMIYIVLETLRQFYPAVFENIHWLIALDATEEVLSNDFGRLLLERLSGETKACLVFEGGTPITDKYALVVARKGKANFKVLVEGRSAHAGNRHTQGANAIIQMAQTVQQIAALTDYEKQLTFNVGTIRGGSVVNRVPHFAEAEVEMRTFSPQVFEDGIAQITYLDGKSQVTSQDGYPCKVTIQALDQTAPWPKNPQTENLFRLWQAIGAELGMRVVAEERGGLSDGNLVWREYPTLDGLGPVGNNAHCSERSADGSKEQEYTVLSSFTPKALLNVLAIARLVDS